MTEVESPIFVFGSGRSGSTFLQHQLCQVEGVWIWGEHEGFLAPLALAYRTLAESSEFRRYATSDLRNELVTNLRQLAPEQSTEFAWISGFTLESLAGCFRENLRSLFQQNLPAGKTRWGFKEVRYGGSDGVPQFLLDLFPAARSIFVVRHPRATIESCLITWNRPRFEAAGAGEQAALDSLREAYQVQAKWWCEVGRNFLDLQYRSGRCLVVPVERYDDMIATVEQFLSVRFPRNTTRFTNSNFIDPSTVPGVVRTLFEEEWHAAEPMVGVVARRLGYEMKPR